MKTNKILSVLPASAQTQLKILGSNIRNARKIRKIGMEELAQRAMTTRETLRRLENGHPGVSLGVLAHVLWVLQLEENVGAVASFTSDPHAQAYIEAGLPKHIRAQKDKDYDF